MAFLVTLDGYLNRHPQSSPSEKVHYRNCHESVETTFFNFQYVKASGCETSRETNIERAVSEAGWDMTSSLRRVRVRKIILRQFSEISANVYCYSDPPELVEKWSVSCYV
jgi:hypothetical protein